MSTLKELSDRLGTPGAEKLYIAAKQRGLNVTKRQVRDFSRRIGERQIYRPVQRAEGRTASEDIDSRFQMDLIDLHTDAAFDKTSGGVNKYILILINVFTREVYARPMASKEPAAVSRELEAIIDKDLPLNPKVISSDNGNEFLGPVSKMLERKKIVQRFKAVGDVNALGVVDKAIQTIKKTMARIMSQEGATRNWREALKQAVTGYNQTYHSAVHEAPGDVRADDQVIFMNLQDNARKLEHNQKLFERRKGRLEEAGAFRAPLPNSTAKFKRGYQATYGQATKVRELQGSTVIGENGVAIDIKRILPVPEDSSAAVGRLGENVALMGKKRELTENLMREAYDFLENKESVSLSTLARHLRSRFDNYDQLLKRANVQLVDIVRLYPEFLKLTGAGKLSKDYYYVARVA